MNNFNSLGMSSARSPQFGKSVVMPLMNTKQRAIEDNFEEIKQKIRCECYPASIKIPFVAKEMLLLNDRQSFLLLSTHGKACYFSLAGTTTSEIMDISAMVQGEARNMVLGSNSRVFIATADFRLFLVDLDSNSKIAELSAGFIKTLYVAPSGTLYILDDELYYTTQNGPHFVKAVWEDYPIYLTVKEDETIAAISTKKNAIYVIDLKAEELLQTLYTENEPFCHKMTTNYIVGAHGGNINIWSLNNWQLLSTKKGFTQLYTCLDVNETETVIAAGCKDGSLHLWSLQEDNLLPMKYTGYSIIIEKVRFITDNYLYYFSSEQSRLMLVDIPDFRKEYSKSLPTGDINGIQCAGEYLIVHLKDNGIYLLDKSDLSFKKHMYNSLEIMYSVTEALNKINILHNDQERKTRCVYLHSLSSLEIENTTTITEDEGDWWASSQTNRAFTDQYLMCGANGILCIMSVYLNIIRDCRLHESSITAAVCLNSGEFSISGDEGGNVLVYNLDAFSQSGKFKQHKAPITVLAVSQNDKLLISGSEDGVFRISDIPSKSCLTTIKIFKSAIKHAYISEEFFAVCTADKELTIWNTRSKTLVASKNNVDAFCVCDDRFFLTRGGFVFSLYNPMNTEQFTVFGNDEDISAYYKYIYKILKYKQPINKPKFNNWLLLPYRVNALHFYAYANLSKHLTVALKNNNYFIEDKQRESPLTICVRNKSLLMKQVIDYLIQKLQNFQGFSCFFDNCLLEITQIGTEQLSDLYSCLFANLHVNQLPEFCDNSVKLPIMIESDNSYNIQLDEFFSPEKKKIGKSIYFKQFAQKLCLEIGSSKSIELFESLMRSPNPEIFRNEFIGLLLDYKWRFAKWIMRIQGVFYFIYLILLISYVSFSLNTELLYLTFVMSVLIMSYEFLQLIGLGWEYFKDVLNLLDMARALLMILVFAAGTTGDTTDEILVPLMIVSLVRGITYFSLFKPTRYLTHLISQVMRDILSFLILLGYSIIAVSAVFTAIDNEGDKGTFLFYLEESFHMSYGNFETDEYNTGERVLFVFASIVNMIIMLNLLISIVGDTFDKFQQSIIQVDRKSVVEMIIEVDKLVFWRRNNNKEKFISICLESKGSDNNEAVWEGKIRHVVNKIDVNRKKIDLNRQMIEAMRMELRAFTEAVSKNYNFEDLKDIKLMLKQNSQSSELIQLPSLEQNSE